MTSTAPFQRTIEDAGNAKVQMANQALQAQREHSMGIDMMNRKQAFEQALQGTKDSAEMARTVQRGQDEIARTREMVDGYVKRMDEKELGQRALELQRNGIEQKQGESLQDFVGRGSNLVVEHHIASLQGMDKQLRQVQGNIDTLNANEENRRAVQAKGLADRMLISSPNKDVQDAIKGGLSTVDALTNALQSGRITNARKVASIRAELGGIMEQAQGAVANTTTKQYLIEMAKHADLYKNIQANRNKLSGTPYGAAADTILASRTPTGADALQIPAVAPKSQSDFGAILSQTPPQDPGVQAATGVNPAFLPDALKHPEVAKAAAMVLGNDFGNYAPGELLSKAAEAAKGKLDLAQRQLNTITTKDPNSGKVVLWDRSGLPPELSVNVPSNPMGGFGGIMPLPSHVPLTAGELTARNLEMKNRMNDIEQHQHAYEILNNAVHGNVPAMTEDEANAVLAGTPPDDR